MSAGNDRAGGLEAYLARAGAEAAGDDAGRLWREGREVGEWTVAGFVGRGGSAEVYCARHRRLGTAAVLKVLWGEGEGPRERFDRETRFLMEGPGREFPAFHGAGVEEGRPWVAMELLEEYPLPKSDAGVAAYLLDVVRGVAELHRRGWVHRDLKPRNILRRASDGHAVLIDFGLLKRAGEDAAAETAAGRVLPSVVDGREVGVGTPGYAAPEQFAGGAATPASDVHALGMLADECFGGKPPRAWERIIRRATGSLPRQRYVDAAAMARAIRRRHWRRNATWAAFAGAVAVALLLGVAPFKPEAVPLPFPASPNVKEARGNAQTNAVQKVAEPFPPAKVGFIDGLVPIPGRAGRIGSREVTQAQWERVMGSNPSKTKDSDLPVDSVSAWDCVHFLAKLNALPEVKAERVYFRFPEEREWRAAAAKAGTFARCGGVWEMTSAVCPGVQSGHLCLSLADDGSVEEAVVSPVANGGRPVPRGDTGGGTPRAMGLRLVADGERRVQ